MNGTRSPRSRYYDGIPYGLIMDRLLAGLHRRVADRVPPGGRVLDACCGTGSLALTLAGTSSEVLGVDLSPRNLWFAERRRRRRRVENARFVLGDVSALGDHGDAAFDVVTLVMALHEMPAEARVPVLGELARVGRELVVVDFQIPMPRNAAGWRSRAAEVVAGPEHFAAFKDYSRRGGLGPVIQEAGLVATYTRTMDAGNLTLQVVRRP